MEFRTERERGRITGGRVVVALYADREYIGAFARAVLAAWRGGSVSAHAAARQTAVEWMARNQ